MAMWSQVSIGDARLQFGSWRLRTSVDAKGVHLFVSCNDSSEAHGEIAFATEPLPPIREMYVRGDELHLILPQGPGTASLNAKESIAGLELVLLPIKTEGDILVLETTLSLQTQWLDVEPTVVLRLPTRGPVSMREREATQWFTPDDLSVKTQNQANDSAPQASLLVESRDLTSLIPSRSQGNQIEFFGEFMEKGVIRKVQPWWIWTTIPLSEGRIDDLAAQLTERPLPLAS
jgi:hypothetical protein